MNQTPLLQTNIHPDSARDRTVLRWLIAGTGAMLLVALLAVVSLTQRANERQALVNHTLQVQAASERLRAGLQRVGRVVMEALAADSAFDPALFESRREEVTQQFRELRGLVGDKPGQVARVLLLRDRTAVQLDRLAALRPEPGPQMQLQIQQSQTGRSELQQELDALVAVEHDLLVEREAALEAIQRWHRVALVCAMSATLALVLSTWLALRTATSRRDRADAAALADRQRLLEERAGLEQLVARRTAELRWLVRTEQLRIACSAWLLGSLGETDSAVVLAGWRERVLASGSVQWLSLQVDGLTLPSATPAPAAPPAASSTAAAAAAPGHMLTLALAHQLGVVSLRTLATEYDDAGLAARKLCDDLGTWLQLRRERAARTRAERERDESAAQLTAVFDQFPQAVVLHDADLKVLRVNEAFTTIAARQGIELLGKNAEEQAAIPGPDQVLPLLRRAQRGEVVKGVPLTQGDLRLLMTTAPLRRPDGQLFGVVGMAMDVSELEDARQRLLNMARRVMQIQEAERRNLALELHDDLGQRLAALKMNLGLMGPPQDPGPDQAIRDDSMRIVEGCIAQVRSRAASLRPALLDEMGLEAALRWHMADQARRSGAAITLECEAPLGRSRGEWANHAYRIVQEALRNALEHGGARDIAVQLHYEAGRVALEVADDGAGLPSDAMLRGNGLPGMRERAAMLGGTFATRAAEPHGTRIMCDWDVAVTDPDPEPDTAPAAVNTPFKSDVSLP